MEVRKYQPDDFLLLRPQAMQVALMPWQTMEIANDLAQSTDTHTATVNGEVIACIGLIQHWPGRRYVWAYLAHNAPMIPLTWKVRRWLKYHGQGRIEAAIDPQFDASVRWARRLGFKREGRMEQYVPGKDYDLYARVG